MTLDLDIDMHVSTTRLCIVETQPYLHCKVRQPPYVDSLYTTRSLDESSECLRETSGLQHVVDADWTRLYERQLASIANQFGFIPHWPAVGPSHADLAICCGECWSCSLL